jgi:DNA-binding protein HU-beta
MDRYEIVRSIAMKTGIARVDVSITLEAFYKEVQDALLKNDNVYIRGFGIFRLKKRNRKIARNINKNTALELPAHFIPEFVPSVSWKEEVKKNTTKFL